MPKHVIVWIDHKEARILHADPADLDRLNVAAPHHLHNRHPRGPGEPKEHPEDAKHFFHEVARSCDAAEEVLVVGPSTAKLEFLRYLHKHDQALEAKVVGVETVDHPTDGQLVAYAKQYFKHADRMR